MSRGWQPPPTEWVVVPEAALARGRGPVRVHTARWTDPAGGAGPVAGPEPTPADPAPAGTAVLVHGLGGSHVNWARLGPLLSRAGWTVWAPDLAGFGLTGLNGRSAAVDDQLDLLAGFIATVADPPVRLVGNSMGGLLALSLAAQRPELVASLVLVAPALPPVGSPDRQVFRRFALGAAPGVAEWWFRHVARHQTPAAQTAEVLHLCVADTSVLDTGLLQAHTAMAAHRRLLGTVERAVPTATRSLLLRLGPGRASVWATVDAVTAPALVVGGEQDRLVTPATLDRLAARRSDWGRVRLDRMGHVPMLEAPEPLAELVAAVPVDRPPWPEGEVVRAAAG